jgi:hypothetical protein
MKIIDADRKLLYQILATIYKDFDISPTIAELGVLKGDNALSMVEFLMPKKMYLIDSWSSLATHEYESINNNRPWVDKPDTYEFYYGGSLSSQETFDKLYSTVCTKFKGNEKVEILRMETLDASRELQRRNVKDIQLIYVDANHSYEKVLDDLMFYVQFLDKHYGCFQLNDCCHSNAGVRQNLGVLEAALKFCKISNFVPLAAVNRDFTDILFAPRDSLMVDYVDMIFNNNDLSYVEVPDQLLGNLSIKVGARANISFI